MAKKTVLSCTVKAQIDKLLASFPPDKQRSAIVMSLMYVQREVGWLADQVLDEVADYLKVPRIDVYEVASFYNMYHRRPVGRYVISVCGSISCALCGSEKLIEHLEKRLGIGIGQTTEDKLFTLKEVECLAACCDAPALQVNDQEYYRKVTIKQADKILDELRAREVSHDDN